MCKTDVSRVWGEEGDFITGIGCWEKRRVSGRGGSGLKKPKRIMGPWRK